MTRVGDDGMQTTTPALASPQKARRRARPVVLAIALVIGAVTAVVLVLTTIDPWFQNIGIFAGSADLHVYRDAGFRVQHDLPLYGGPVLLGHLYTYTPFSALVFVPAAKIPAAWVDNIVMATNICLLVAAIVLCWRMLGYRLTPKLVGASALLALCFTFLEPIRTTLFYGQVNIGLMLLVLWDFSRKDDSKIKGIGVGLAAAIKLTPGYFVAYSLALRQWRVAAVSVGTFFASIAVGWLVLPDDSRAYWTEKFFEADRVAFPTHPANQSLRGVIAHLIGHQAPGVVWFPLAAGVALLSLYVSVRLHRDGERLLALALCGMTSAAVSPFSWSHHWIWFVPLLVWIAHRALSNPRWWFAAAAIYLPAAAWSWQYSDDFAVVGLFMYPPWWSTIDILMNIYMIMFVFILAAAVVGVRRRHPRESFRSPWTPKRLTTPGSRGQ